MDEEVAAVNIGRATPHPNSPVLRLEGEALACANLGGQVRMASAIRAEIPPRPDGMLPGTNPCLPDFDQGLVDAYNDSLPRALAALLMKPEAQSLSATDLQGAFNRVAEVRILVEGDGYFLASIPVWSRPCAGGSRHNFTVNLYVLNRQGDYWPIGSLFNLGSSGKGLRAADVQWAGDRWVAVVNNDGTTLCSYCYSIWHIRRAGDGWTTASFLELGKWNDPSDRWVNTPQLTLLDGYRRIALNLSPDYVELLCQFTPFVQADLYMIWKEIRREYVWEADGYRQVAETDVATHVVIDAVDGFGRRTYRQLKNWQDFCV